MYCLCFPYPFSLVLPTCLSAFGLSSTAIQTFVSFLREQLMVQLVALQWSQPSHSLLSYWFLFHSNLNVCIFYWELFMIHWWLCCVCGSQFIVMNEIGIGLVNESHKMSDSMEALVYSDDVITW
jgi:hypothetical protein